jgi:hypothetical protein
MASGLAGFIRFLRSPPRERNRDERQGAEQAGDEQVVVYSWPNGRDKEIRATWTNFNGARWAHLRVFVADDQDGMHPTKKGIAVRDDALHHLETAIQKLREAA